MVGRPKIPRNRKVSFHIACALANETGELLEDLSTMTKRPLGSLAREAICVMLEKEKPAILEWRKTHLEAAE
jgi:hypothetical protein